VEASETQVTSWEEGWVSITHGKRPSVLSQKFVASKNGHSGRASPLFCYARRQNLFNESVTQDTSRPLKN
jgi:hypothetical protein